MLKVYRTNILYFTESPLVIVASKENGDDLFGEYYILLNNIDQTGFWQRICAKKSQMVNPYFIADEDYIFNEAKDIALEKLHTHQSELYLQTMGKIYIQGRYEYTSEVDLRAITQLIFRRNYLNSLNRIKDQTKNDELQSYLSAISNVSPIRYESI